MVFSTTVTLSTGTHAPIGVVPVVELHESLSVQKQLASRIRTRGEFLAQEIQHYPVFYHVPIGTQSNMLAQTLGLSRSLCFPDWQPLCKMQGLSRLVRMLYCGISVTLPLHLSRLEVTEGKRHASQPVPCCVHVEQPLLSYSGQGVR